MCVCVCNSDWFNESKGQVYMYRGSMLMATSSHLTWWFTGASHALHVWSVDLWCVGSDCASTLPTLRSTSSVQLAPMQSYICMTTIVLCVPRSLHWSTCPSQPHLTFPCSLEPGSIAPWASRSVICVRVHFISPLVSEGLCRFFGPHVLVVLPSRIVFLNVLRVCDATRQKMNTHFLRSMIWRVHDEHMVQRSSFISRVLFFMSTSGWCDIYIIYIQIHEHTDVYATRDSWSCIYVCVCMYMYIFNVYIL